MIHFPERSQVPAPSHPSPGALAARLSARLDCAVLAMRYPVGDEFSIELSAKLYDLLARQGQSLPRAVALTMRHLADGTGGQALPALSMAAPALFGDTAAELTLAAPQRAGPPSVTHESVKMAGFPPQPDRFVGRTAVMTRSSAALAARSGGPGVLLHGMPGGGKTACALELAYTVDKLTSGERLAGFLPILTEVMERHRLLIVIDNAESLLTGSGDWRDARWGQVFGALTGHAGLGRAVITSRRAPAGASHAIARSAPAGASALHVEAVDALTADEALLLARELPHLRALIHGELPGLDRDVSRQLAVGVLTIAQGHPKLLELADGQAADPDHLAALVEAGDRAWHEQGGLPDGFFSTGETAADPGDYLHVLAAWTKMVTGTLAPAQRDLFRFLRCLEEPDRERFVVKDNWPFLWKLLGRDDQSPGIDSCLAALAGSALIAVRTNEDMTHSYDIHPEIAATGRTGAGQKFRDTADRQVVAFWDAVFRFALGENDDREVDTGLLVRAGVPSVPYSVPAPTRRLISRTCAAGSVISLVPIRPRSSPGSPAIPRPPSGRSATLSPGRAGWPKTLNQEAGLDRGTEAVRDGGAERLPLDR